MRMPTATEMPSFFMSAPHLNSNSGAGGATAALAWTTQLLLDDLEIGAFDFRADTDDCLFGFTAFLVCLLMEATGAWWAAKVGQDDLAGATPFVTDATRLANNDAMLVKNQAAKTLENFCPYLALKEDPQKVGGVAIWGGVWLGGFRGVKFCTNKLLF